MPITTIEDYMRLARQSFVPEHAHGRRAVLQYHFTGRVTGSCYVRIENDTLLVAQGTHPTSNDHGMGRFRSLAAHSSLRGGWPDGLSGGAVSGGGRPRDVDGIRYLVSALIATQVPLPAMIHRRVLD